MQELLLSLYFGELEQLEKPSNEKKLRQTGFFPAIATAVKGWQPPGKMSIFYYDEKSKNS